MFLIQYRAKTYFSSDAFILALSTLVIGHVSYLTFSWTLHLADFEWTVIKYFLKFILVGYVPTRTNFPELKTVFLYTATVSDDIGTAVQNINSIFFPIEV